MLITLNDFALETLLVNDEGFSLVAFYAFDLIPCDHFMPEYKKAAVALIEYVACYSIEAVENPTIVDCLKVLYVPTVILFYGGKEIKRLEGPYSFDAMVTRIRSEIRRARQ